LGLSLPPPSPRTIVYIDGFNLYYGAVRGTPYKWLDLEKYFRMIRQHDDIVAIKYFTAWVMGPTLPNQQAFLAALATRPLIQPILATSNANASSAASLNAAWRQVRRDSSTLSKKSEQT
jgi:hypothetical protein